MKHRRKSAWAWFIWFFLACVAVAVVATLAYVSDDGKIAGTPGYERAYYRNCDEAAVLRPLPIRGGEPGYRSGLDKNHNMIACEAGE